ncbi:RNA polymerase factor sigma-54 [Aquibacillus halophilus]|uniref:RNA polymerase factor sigma-54 n=1 Tax=Aquibacillus halophilus TaxID=930132 RepID=A0A6A8D7D6_9BACI|nr:RNA polymerase factor sigma-54 [Aquibacillus halophilus]MRH41190.1 RNA polymerase factor sigma-54 [Aquibacillus halophilus]
MQMALRIEQKQKLQLALTPELYQSINILQYSAIDLNGFLNQQIYENPLLETYEERTDSSTYQDNVKSEFSWKREMQGIYRNKTTGAGDIAEILSSSNETTLEMHLIEQISFIDAITQSELQTIKFLIRNLNENGYLTIDENLAALMLGVSVAEVGNMAKLLQTFDPIGVGAKNLKDCLLIQMRHKKNHHRLACEIVENYLEDIANKKYKKISAIFSIPMSEVQEVIDYIQTLNPRPGEDFTRSMVNYIIPDVIVKKEHNGYVVQVNDYLVPDLTINYNYKALVEEDNGAHRYIQEKLNDAVTLIRGVEHRKTTLYEVTKAILDYQFAFFEHGVSELKAMTLNDIAKIVSLHESTVSRATSNKYIQTPMGIFEFKYFFTNGLGALSGMKSVKSIKDKLEEIINTENKEKPLSDQKITIIFANENINVSRRTIAKYREELGILPSSKRKRWK